MNGNPYTEAVNRVLEVNRSWHVCSGADRAAAMTDLLIALGSSETTGQNGILPPDPGAAALLGLCLLLRRHGGALHALTKAHEAVHDELPAPGDGSLPLKKAW